MSRLDRIYASHETIKWARDWRIEPVGVKTDHNMVSVMITTATTPTVGKGRPVFLRLNTDRSVGHPDPDLRVLCGYGARPRSGPDPDPGSPGSADPDPGNPQVYL